MKIALAVDSFDPRRGGSGSWACQLAERLARRGHQVHVVARAFSSESPSSAIVAHPLGERGSPLRIAAAAEATLRALKVDVVHDIGLGWYADVFSLDDAPPDGEPDAEPGAAGWLRRRLGRLARRFLPRPPREKSLVRRRLAESDSVIVAHSAMAADAYRTGDGVTPERLRVVYPGVDIKRYSPHLRTLRRDATRRKLNVTSGELLLLTVAHDFHRKGMATTLGALRRLVSQGHAFRFVAVGGRTGRRQCENLATRLGLAKSVSWLGEDADPAPYYAAADAFVLPTAYDPFSITVLEAAACGLPTITSRRDGAGELLADGREGCLLDSAADDAELAGCLKTLLDASRRERMGRAARRTAMNHTLDRSVDQLVAIYDEIFTRRQTPSRQLPAAAAIQWEGTENLRESTFTAPGRNDSIPTRRAA